MAERLGRGRLRWLATVCVLVVVAGLVSSAKSAMSESTKRVTYKGYRIEVPDSWPVVDLARDPNACVRFDVHAVYLGHPGSQSSCPAKTLGRTDALLLEPIDRGSKARASGAAAWTPKGKAASAVPARTSHEVTIGVSQAGVLVTASYGSDPATLDGIVGGATLTSDAQPATDLAPATTAATSVVVPATYNGSGFDACSAPSSTAMQAWQASPYRAVGVYIGGISRACAQPNLTAAWVDEQVSAGWSLVPTYVGLQAPCTGFKNRIDPADPASQARQAAEDAVVSAGSLGMAAGSVLYYDMEGYSTTDSACRDTVLSFLSNWSTRLHELGYKSGVYSSASSGIRDLVSVYDSTTLVRPDHVWFARWDGVATVSDTVVPSTYWPNHQRLKQYQGGHNETWGGVTINIDNDYLDVATDQAPPPPPVDDGDQDSPAAVTVGTEIHAFALGTDKRLYEAVYRKGSGWSSWSPRGTQTFMGSPSAIAYSTGINLYARGEDQRVYESYLRSGSSWSSWRPHSGLDVAGAPVAVTDGTNISVFARGTDQRLYDTTFRPTTRWSGWVAHPGVSVAGNPGAVSLGSEFHVFVRGTDGGLYETFYRPSFGWSSWTPHAGPTVAGDPSAVRWGTGGINLFVRGADQRLYETYYRPKRGWAGWGAHGGMTLDGDPTAFVYGTEIHVLARNTADVMAETYYRSGAGWTAWARHGGVTMAGTPAAVLYGSGINVYVRGSGNHLYETYFRPSSGWSAWHVKGGTAVSIA
jgi:Rv2525c-like, glycoside hydrolase-like domain